MYKPGTFSWKFFEKKVCPGCDKKARFHFMTAKENPKIYRCTCEQCGCVMHFTRKKDHYEIKILNEQEELVV